MDTQNINTQNINTQTKLFIKKKREYKFFPEISNTVRFTVIAICTIGIIIAVLSIGNLFI